MMQSLLRDFHFKRFQISHFIPVFCFGILYTVVNWIKYATVFVWVCWYGCQTVVDLCVIQKKYMCAVHVILRKEKLNCNSFQSQSMFCCMGKVCYCAQTKFVRFGTQLIYINGFDFLAVFELFYKICI